MAPKMQRITVADDNPIAVGIVSSLPEYFLGRYTQQPESDKVGYTMYTKK